MNRRGKVILVVIFFAVLQMVTIFETKAQNTPQQEIELKDGKKLIGTVVKHIPNKYIYFVSFDSSLYVFPVDEIGIIRNVAYRHRQPAYAQIRTETRSSPKILDGGYKKSGYSFSIYGKFLYTQSYAASISLGKFLSPGVMAGIEIGYDTYRNIGAPFATVNKPGLEMMDLKPDVFLPTMVYLKFFSSNYKTSFVGTLGVGYSWFLPSLSQTNGNGIMIKEGVYRKTQAGGFLGSASIGIRVFSNTNTAFLYEIGVRAQAYAAKDTRITNPTSNSGSFSSTTQFLSFVSGWNLSPFISVGICF